MPVPRAAAAGSRSENGMNPTRYGTRAAVAAAAIAVATCTAAVLLAGCAGAGFNTVPVASSVPRHAAHPPASMAINGEGAGMGPSTGAIGIGFGTGVARGTAPVGRGG
jgi:hypothetical protein